MLTDGYMEISPDQKTTAIQHVDVKDSEKVSYRNFQDYLQSHVSGVEISSSGGIVIRGMGTFNGSSDPLILMDGGTAAYGLRGANGVILITSEAAYQIKQAEREAKKREKEAAKTE